MLRGRCGWGLAMRAWRATTGGNSAVTGRSKVLFLMLCLRPLKTRKEIFGLAQGRVDWCGCEMAPSRRSLLAMGRSGRGRLGRVSIGFRTAKCESLQSGMGYPAIRFFRLRRMQAAISGLGHVMED